MTREEARLAVWLNAEVTDKNGVIGYACSISLVHMKGKEALESVGYHDIKANCVYQSQISDLTVTDWKAPDYMLQNLRDIAFKAWK